jgi:hypothetical protein
MLRGVSGRACLGITVGVSLLLLVSVLVRWLDQLEACRLHAM